MIYITTECLLICCHSSNKTILEQNVTNSSPINKNFDKTNPTTIIDDVDNKTTPRTSTQKVKIAFTLDPWDEVKKETEKMSKKMYFIVGGIAAGLPVLCIIVCLIKAFLCKRKTKVTQSKFPNKKKKKQVFRKGFMIG